MNNIAGSTPYPRAHATGLDDLRSLIKSAVLRAKLTRRRFNPVVIYQMGKVGSTSIYASLKSAGVDALHVHRINPDNIESLRRTRAAVGIASPGEGLGKLLFKEIEKDARPLKFISLTREPIGRNISAFFQGFAVFNNGQEADMAFTNPEAIENFLNNYSHDTPLRWFNAEIKQVLGVDVLARPFPREIGHQIFRAGRHRLLVLKSELPDTEKAEAICSFLEIDSLKISSRNVSQDKKYASLYKAFLDAVSLPQEYVDKMCSSDYFQHFYTDGEIEQVRKRWSSGDKAAK